MLLINVCENDRGTVDNEDSGYEDGGETMDDDEEDRGDASTTSSDVNDELSVNTDDCELDDSISQEQQGSSEGLSKYTAKGQQLEKPFLKDFFDGLLDIYEGTSIDVEAIYSPGLVRGKVTLGIGILQMEFY